MQQINLEGEIMGYPKKTVITTIIIVLVAFGSFYVGTRYEKRKFVKIMAANEQATAKKIEALNKLIPSNQLVGTVANVSDKGVITLTLTDKTSQTITTNETTKYGETGNGTIAIVTDGAKVAVMHTGTKNADGSFTAESIKNISTKAPKSAKTKKTKDATKSADTNTASE